MNVLLGASVGALRGLYETSTTSALAPKGIILGLFSEQKTKLLTLFNLKKLVLQFKGILKRKKI